MTPRFLLLAVPALLAACAPKSPVESSPAADAALAIEAPDEPIPFDPAVRHGVLDNGVRYFIETNDKPDDRAVFRLVVDAGSVLEDEDQRGLAHFVEHMAFNGTTHFEGNELIKYLERTGTRFGAHLNAHTGFDETVYKLQVPTDDPELFGKAFLILEDWAHGMRFDEQEVERERGVVLEEWRRSLGPYERSFQVTMPVSYPDSPYPDRLPIGTEESLKTFTHDAAKRFYEDWYRPDLMSVIVVGDVDPDAVEAKIREHFGRIEAPDSPRERVHPEIGAHEQPQYVVFADPEITRTSLSIESPHDWTLEPTYQEYREGFVQQAFFGVLSERFGDLSRDPSSPLLGAGGGRTRKSPTEGSWVLGGAPQEGRILEAYETMLVELKRIRTHGVTDAELGRVKAGILRSMESYYQERDKTESTVHAEELVRHATTGEAVPGITVEWELAQKYVPTITAAEVQAFAREIYLPEGNRAVTVLMPDKAGLAAPTADEFRAVEARVAAAEVAPPDKIASDAPLVSDLPEPGKIVEQTRHEALGYTIWKLSNGAEVWVKPTDFEAEQILFRGRSKGGHNLASDADYVAATTATDLVALSGLGELEAPDLAKRLAGHSVGVRPWISGTHEGVSGASTPQDLELLLQLTWLTFTAPRFDEQALELSKRDRAERLRNRESDPRTAYSDAYTKLVWQDFPRYRPWTEATLDQMDLARSKAFYEGRFSDASDFRFVFVGNVDPEALKPLVEQYLAALPSGDREEAFQDLGARRVEGRHEATIESGSDPKAEVAILMHGAFDSTFLTRNRLQALQEVLSTRLREVLREDKGGVYGVSVSTSSDWWPEEAYTLQISFTCDPERVPELEKATQEVLEQLQQAPVADSYIEAYKQKSLRGRQEDLRDNGFWTGIADGTVDELEGTGEDLADVLTYEQRVRSLTAEELQAFAKQILTTDNFVILRHMPKG